MMEKDDLIKKLGEIIKQIRACEKVFVSYVAERTPDRIPTDIGFEYVPGGDIYYHYTIKLED